MTASTPTSDAPEPVVPSWPSYMPVRPSRPWVDVVCFVVIVALLAGAAVLYRGPWRTSGRVGGTDLERYAPEVDGTSSLFEVRDGEEKVSGYESQNTDKIVAAEVFLALPSEVRGPVIAGAAADEASARDFGLEQMATLTNLDSSFAALERAEVFQVREVAHVTGQEEPERGAAFEVRGPQGLFTAGFLRSAGDVVSFNPPLLTVPAHIVDGEQWKASGTFGFSSYTYEAEGSGHGGFDTPFGHFDDCVTITNTTVLGDGPSQRTLDGTSTLCAGIGFVDGRTTTEQGGTSTVRHDVLVRSTQHPAGGDVALSPVPTASDTTSLSSPDTWNLTRFARTATTGTSIGATAPPTFVPLASPLVVVPDENGDVVAYDASTRIERWRFHAGGAVFGQPSFDAESGTLLFGASDRRIYSLGAQGSFKWAFRTGDNVASRPIVLDGVVVVGSEDKNVYGLDVANGSERWRVAD